MMQTLRKSKAPLLFLLLAGPNLLLIAVFAYWPVIGNILLSFTQWDMMSPVIQPVGLDNYLQLFGSTGFWRTMGVTLIWVVVVVTATVIGGALLGLLFSAGGRLGGASSAVAFVPHIVSGAAVSAIWLFIFDPHYGISRAIFELFGASSPDWFTSQQWALPALLIISVWSGLGFNALIYMSAIKAIPQDVLEAARLDGAGFWDRFKDMILPLLSPTTFFLSVTSVISAFQVFDVIAMTTQGGPANSTTTLSWFIYEAAFVDFRVGHSAAAGTIMFLILMAITAFQFKFIQRKVHYA